MKHGAPRVHSTTIVSLRFKLRSVKSLASRRAFHIILLSSSMPPGAPGSTNQQYLLFRRPTHVNEMTAAQIDIMSIYLCRNTG